MQEFKLPDLGEGMQEAEIRRWLIKPGDVVKLDQPMVEVETDKAVVEIPSPVRGQVTEIRVQEGKVAKLGEVLVIFDAQGNAAPKEAPAQAVHDVKANEPVLAKAESIPLALPQASLPAAGKQRVLAAPAVRKRAFELDIDLALVTPSQASGRVTLEDVLAYAEHGPTATAITEQPTPATEIAIEQAPVALASTHQNGASRPVSQPTPVASTATDERQPLTGLRRRIAERMEHSWRSIPHASAFDELDGTELVALRTLLKSTAEQRGVRLTYMPLLVKLLLPALKEFPIFNAHFDEERREIVYKRAYHIGIAADSPEGLLVPVLRDSDRLTVLQIATQLEHLIQGAQKRTLALSEVAGSTFTLNNIGSFGGSSGTPIINAPEVAILAVGRLQEKAIVRNGVVSVRTVMPLTLSFDHRVVDGALSGRFLARFKELVEHPQQLLLDMV
jgi:pyruvate dehydrogenase E2 component (dihydrolipoyllysine-residue acetyltransferase)